MNIDIWSDFSCPFCYIGKRRFEQALKQFVYKDEIKVNYRSFQLNPEMKREGNLGTYDLLASKFGITREQAITNTNHLAAQAKQLGLDYYFDRMIHTNTYDAHRLAHFATTMGKGAEMAERLLKAYFTDTLHLGDFEVLAKLAAELGLNPAETKHMLERNEYSENVKEDIREASRIGIHGVPFFVINDKYTISGAQQSEVFLGAIEKAWEEAHPPTMIGMDGDLVKLLGARPG